MKKCVVVVCLSVFSTLLMGGGKVAAPKLSQIVPIPSKSCKADKVYVDKDERLMWQDQPFVNAEDGAYKRSYSIGKVGSWGHAVNYCSALSYAGYSDWRLPTADELMEVHRKEGQVFSYFRGSDFWSSTPAKANKYYVVFPADAYQYARHAKETNYIRCVRCLDGKPADHVSGNRETLSRGIATSR
jgi:hypothetical protein